MKVALTGEGTYPHQFGGVSVWCDQLVRGLPQYDFTLVPVVATGNEPMRWELPDNVSSVLPIPLWGRPPAISLRARMSRGGGEAMLAELIDVLLSPPEQAQDRFTDVMHELFNFAQTRNLRAALGSENAVRMLSDAWRQRWPHILPELAGPSAEGLVPSLGDAVTAMQLIEHSLRSFSFPPVEADVAHVVTNGLAALPAFAAKWRYGMPMIVTEHGVYMREQYLHLRRPEFGWPVKDFYLRFLRRVCTLGYHEAEVITPGNIYNKRWEAELGADESRVRTVYNGVDPAVFPVVSEEPEVPTLSWAGRIDPVKDLFTLLRAFSLVVREIPEARLRIFGSPPQGGEAYLERCLAEAADLGISEQATFEGRVPQIRDAYAAGHVVVLCSIAEGFPYTLIEAMVCGRACVATNVGGVSEAIGDAGVVVPPRNPAALADACLRLLRDDKLRQEMGTAARERAVEHFTVDRAISAFDEMYSDLGGARTVPVATSPQPAHWIELPPEEELTVIAPRLDPAVLDGQHQPQADQDATQIVPVMPAAPVLPVVAWEASDPEHTVILPRLVVEEVPAPAAFPTAAPTAAPFQQHRAQPEDRGASPLDLLYEDSAEPPAEDDVTSIIDLRGRDGGDEDSSASDQQPTVESPVESSDASTVEAAAEPPLGEAEEDQTMILPQLTEAMR
jgi:glycosyltransferase involved in cell wall biosynthesis